MTIPVFGETPSTIAAGTNFTGTIAWSGAPTTFASSTVYTATITLTAAAGYVFSGVAANFFTVTGATTVTNAAGSNIVTAIFPETALQPGYIKTQNATGGTIGAPTGWSLNGGGSLVWAKIATEATWSNASAQCTALGAGWRMPTQGELSGLRNTASTKAAATTEGWAFSNTWSSNSSSEGYHYMVSLYFGHTQGQNDTYSSYVSCVR